MEQHTAHNASVLSLGEDWFDPLEAGVRQRIRSSIEEMLEAELEAALQRRRYERAFAGNHPHAIWLADITSVVTDEGWLYLAAVKDLAAGEIVGWGMADHLKSSLCESVLLMAIHHRAPPVGLIHPSDRGVQYTCESYRKILERHGFQVSMSGKGDCYDNAPMESFFGSLKTERVHLTRFRTRREAEAALFEYIEIFYNWRRRHSEIGYRTPAQADAEMLMKAAA